MSKKQQRYDYPVECLEAQEAALKEFRDSLVGWEGGSKTLGDGTTIFGVNPENFGTPFDECEIDPHTAIVKTDQGIFLVADKDSDFRNYVEGHDEWVKRAEIRAKHRIRIDIEDCSRRVPDDEVPVSATISEVLEDDEVPVWECSAEDQQTASVDGYFECVKYAYDGWHRRHEGAVTWGRPFNTEEFTRHLYAMLRRARLVHIPLEVYATLYHHNDVRLTVEAGYPWSPPDPSKADPYIVQRVSDVTKQAMAELPFPERLPFDCVYFAFGGGIELTREQLRIKTGGERARSLRGAVLIALLLGSHGVCVEFLAGHHVEQGSMIFAVCHRTWGEDLWLPSTEPGVPQDLAPFMATSLVEHVNSFVELSVSTPHSKQHRKDWRRGRKKLGVNKGEPPPEFYPYKLRSTLHRETDGGGGDGIVRTYRTDVRGHERLLVRRGDLPLPLRKREYYRTQGFKIFETEPPPPELREKLRVKGHPSKLRHEWMVVKSIWIDPHLNSNDESLPYVKRLNVA